MDAASRSRIRKKKEQARAAAKGSFTVTAIDLEGVREATKHKFAELLDGGASNKATKDKALKIARAIEKAINEQHNAHTPAYRVTFRRLYVSLKSKQSDFKQRLLNGELDPAEFARKTTDELKSSEQREADKELKEKSMQDSVSTQLLPENVNQIKDGRDREKWGVSRSAAAIDD